MCSRFLIEIGKGEKVIKTRVWLNKIYFYVKKIYILKLLRVIKFYNGT